MKKRCLIFLASLLVLGACSHSNTAPAKARTEVDFDTLEDNDYTPSTGHSEELGSFALTYPENGTTIDTAGNFKWEGSENADTYTLELSTSEQFISDNDRIDYYHLENITTTDWNIGAALALQNITYYWRVYAVNDSGKKICNETFSFYYKAPEVEEVEFALGTADEWQLHPDCSYAELVVDKSNFFNNNKDALKITFNIEDTNQGNKSSDGWTCFTKTIEKTIYGTDALYFDSYYAGQDSEVYIRLIDRDGEYWVCPILVSVNAKQKVILKFSDFYQERKDVPVNNETFDVERIKYMEVLLKNNFGDGLYMISDIKAIKFSNYSNFFIKDLDFKAYDNDRWEYENYNFTKIMTNSQLTLGFSSSATSAAGKINGYGFVRLKVEQYFVTGDAIQVSVRCTGSKGSNAIIRIVEEDNDRWSYKFPYDSLSSTYKTFTIPYAAFAKSDIQGDGKRQFYSIKNIQFGVEGQYGTGMLFFKDFKIIDKPAAAPKVVNDSGMIEDFNSYTSTSDIFLTWSATDINKDEYIQLNSENKVGGSNNPYAGQFEYKSDMEPAKYTVPVQIETEEEFSSLKLWMKDISNKTGDARFGHITNWSPKTTIYISLTTGEEFHYELGTIDRIWREYNIPLKEAEELFILDNGADLDHDPNPITSAALASVSFDFQYFYYNAMSAPQPQYTNSNPVLVDNIGLGKVDEYYSIEKEKVVKMNEDGFSLVDDFENYKGEAKLDDNWKNAQDYTYQKMELSDKVSSEGGSKSMALQMKAGAESPSYAISPAFDQNVIGRAVKVDLYSEKELTIYINIYLTIGSSKFQYRATIEKVATKWTTYTLGLNNFIYIADGSSFDRPLSGIDLIYMSKFTIGMVYSDGTSNLYNLYVDNLMFDYNQLYSVNETREIPEVNAQ